jgi:colanic acid/amylovoran biosynthesis glycosyltransferase
MKVCYFSTGFPSRNSRFILDEVEHFASAESLTYLFTQQGREEEKGAIDVPRIQLKQAQSAFRRKLNWWLWRAQWRCDFKNAELARNARLAMATVQPDLIHCHFAYEGLTLYDNLAFDGPWIFHFHGYDASEMLRNRAYVRKLRYLASKSNVHFIYCSENIRGKLKGKGIVNPRSHVLHYGIDLQKFTFDQKPSNDALRLVHVSNLQEKKGLKYSLAAFKRFIQSSEGNNARFVIIGGAGKALADLHEMVRALQLQEVVELMGQKSKEDVAAELAKSDVFVHHSITAANGDQEGIPNAIMEAMAMGLPILSSVHSGIPELVEDGVHGYLSPEQDVDHIYESMVKIARWEQYRSQACRNKIETEFNKIHHLNDLGAIYRSLLAS